VPAGVDLLPLARWARATSEQGVDKNQEQLPASARLPDLEGRQYLAVPYEDRHEAKAAGAEWDKVVKSWYVGPQADPALLQRWAPNPRTVEQEPAMHPRDEFAQAMRDHGLVVEGDHPIMDGNKHRVPVEGGKKGAVDGFYVLFADGHPAGRIINHKTGVDEKWKSKGYSLSPEQRANLQAEAAANLVRRAAALVIQHEQAAARVSAQLTALQPVTEPTPYLISKGVQVHPGAFTDREQKTTFIPAIDADNKVWSMQYIQEDGTKRFAKDTRKEGCFHAVGGLDALARAPAVVIAEGYATAATLSEALEFATIAAFDSGNLIAVAKALQARFPDKLAVIAGDDDQHLVTTLGKNPGREKMEQAANAVGAVKLLPIFAPGEQEARPGVFTDFNDLATKSVLGREGVERQVRSVVQAAVDTHAVGVQVPEARKLVQTQAQRHGRQLADESGRQRRLVRIY
jgi:putative DNA primase/helicase